MSGCPQLVRRQFAASHAPTRRPCQKQALAQRMTLTHSSMPLPAEGSRTHPLYTVRPEERSFLQQHWIATEPDAYRQAHEQAWHIGLRTPTRIHSRRHKTSFIINCLLTNRSPPTK
ncbi:MAG: hypothetical protein R3E31_11010 [Chloroflexota bacterium]